MAKMTTTMMTMITMMTMTMMIDRLGKLIHYMYICARIYMCINYSVSRRRCRSGTSHFRIWRHVACHSSPSMGAFGRRRRASSSSKAPSAGQLATPTQRTHACTHASRRHRVFPQERARERFRLFVYL